MIKLSNDMVDRLLFCLLVIMVSSIMILIIIISDDFYIDINKNNLIRFGAMLFYLLCFIIGVLIASYNKIIDFCYKYKIIYRMKLFERLYIYKRDNDPVYGCKLYKEDGCSHVDGILCDYPNCSILNEYLNKNKEIEKINNCSIK